MTYANNIICSTCVKVYACTYMCMMGSCTLLTKPGCLFFRQSSKGYAHYTQSKALGHTWNWILWKVGNAVVLWCQCWLAKSCSLQCKMLAAFSRGKAAAILWFHIMYFHMVRFVCYGCWKKKAFHTVYHDIV